MVSSKRGAGAFHGFVVVLHFFLSFHAFFLVSASNNTASTGLSFQFIHRDSKLSPYYSANLTDDERIERLLQLSHARMQWMKYSSLGVFNLTTIRPPVYEHTSIYMVAVNLGTGHGLQDYFLELDTGSGLTWTQCNPCNPCFNQDAPIFEPPLSPTYRRVPCNDRLCRPPFRCNNNACTFEITYGDSSTVRGFLSRDTFSFQALAGRGHVSIPNLAFGCSHASRVEGYRSEPAGLMGLNGRPESFAVQLAGITGGRFSYCLFHPGGEGFSHLRFGNDIVMREPVQRTPLVIPQDSGNYYVNLLSISLNNVYLNIDPRVLARRTDGSGGVIIDAGASVTFLIRPAFVELRRAVVQHFSGYNINPVRPDLGLCFNMRSGVQRLWPPMTFHFQGANLLVAGQHMFHVRQQVFCLAVNPYNDMTLIGAPQQRNTRMTFDLRQRALLFTPEDCSQDGG